MQDIRNYFFVFLLTIVVSCQQPSTTRTVVHSPPKPGDFKIIGYLPGRSVDTAAIAFHRLTHINFAFAIPAKNGGGLDALRNADKLAALVKKAHRHNVKVFISIGGWSMFPGAGFQVPVSSSEFPVPRLSNRAGTNYNALENRPKATSVQLKLELEFGSLNHLLL